MRHRCRAGVLALAAFVPASAAAQAVATLAEPDAQSPKKDYAQISLEDLLNRDIAVAATKTRVDVMKAPVSVSVLTPEDIRRSGATTLAELFRMVPGFDVLEAFPGYVSVSARGTSESFVNNMLVLIDGRRFENQFTGVPFLEEAPLRLDDIKRIEVIKGPVGALYGTNALAGVVSITTYGARELPGTLVSLTSGNRDTYQASLRQSGRIGSGPWAYKLSGGYSYSSTWGSLGANYTLPPVGLRRGDLLGLLERRFEDDSRLEIEGAYSKGDLASLTIVTNQTQYFEQPHLRVGYSRPDFHTQFTFGVQKNELRERVPPIQVLKDDGGRTASLSADRSFQLSERSLVTVGGNVRHQRSAFTSLGGPHSQWVGGVFAQDEQTLVKDRLTLFGAAGLSHHPEIPLQVDGNAALVATPFDDHSFRVSFGRAHRDPAFLENFIDFRRVIAGRPGYQTSNRDLAPEEIVSLEVGYHGRIRAGTSRLSFFAEGFREDLNDLINIVTTPVPPGTVAAYPEVTVLQQFKNVESRSGKGFEVGGDWERASIRLSANYSYQRFKNATTELDILRDIPRHKVSAGLSTRAGRLEIDVWVHSVSKTLGDKGYVLVNPRLGFHAGQWRLSVQAFNAFDDQHVETANARDIKGEIVGRQITFALTFGSTAR